MLPKILCVSIVLVAAVSAHAQDDPFGAPPANPAFGGNPFGAAPANPAAPAAAAAGPGAATRPGALTDPLLIEILATATRGLSGLGEAIRRFSEINRLDMAGDLLQQLVGRTLSGDENALIANQIGDAMLFRLRNAPQITAEQKAIVATLQTARATAATDPARLRAAVADLGSDDFAKRRQAQRTLSLGGTATIEALVAALLQTTEAVPRQAIQNELRRLEDDAFLATEVAAQDGPVDRRSIALATLIQLDRRRSLLPESAALPSAQREPDDRQAISNLLDQHFTLRRLPGTRETVALLREDLHRQLKDWRATPVSSTEDRPTWAFEGETSRYQPMPLRQAAGRRAAITAEWLRRIDSLPADVQAEALVTDLAVRFAADSGFGLQGTDLVALAQRWQIPSDELVTVLESALTFARKQELPEGSIAVIRLLATFGDPTVLRSAGGQPRPLVAAANDPVPAVRLEAAGAAATLQSAVESDALAYVGEAMVAQRWNEMRRLTDRPEAMVVEPVPGVAEPLIRWLEALGYSVTWARTGNEALVALQESSNLELAVVGSRQADAGPVEIIDRLRNAPKGAAVAVLVLGPVSIPSYESWEAPTEWVPEVNSVEMLAQWIESLRSRSTRWVMEALDRDRLKAIAEKMGK